MLQRNVQGFPDKRNVFRYRSVLNAVIIIFCVLLSNSFPLFASKTNYPFFIRAKSHYTEEITKKSGQSPDNHEIDSILRIAGTAPSFEMAYSVSRRISLYLLEQAKYPIALDILNETRKYLESRSVKTPAEQSRISSIYNIIGAIYEETGLWNEALELYMQSLHLCNEINNQAGKAKVYNNLGKLYFSRNELDKAEGLYFKAAEINKSLGIKPELFNNYNNLAGSFKQRNNTKKALEFALIALNQLDIHRDNYDLSILYSNIGNLYQDMRNFTVALSYYHQAVELQDRNMFQIPLIHTWLSIGSVYDALKNNDSVVKYLSLSLNLAQKTANPSQKLDVFLYAAKYYQKTENYRQASRFYSEYVRLNDSLTVLNSLNKIEQVQAVYEVINKEKDNQILQQKINLQQLSLQRQRIIIAASALIFLSLVYSLLMLQKNRRRERQKTEVMARQTDLFHKKEKEILLDKEHALELELDHKNRQLTSYALHLARNNEFISRTTNELKQVLLAINPKDKERTEQIRWILSSLQQYSTGNDWEEFRLYFQEVHQSFEKNLTSAFPTLSPHDKKICALLKLGLSTKDIASITFRELRSVESARNRLRKKLGLAADVNIHSFLSQF